MAKKSAKGEDKSKDEGKKTQDVKDYTISNLAKELDVEAASARVALRKNGIPKSGGRYGWDTKQEMLEVVKKIRAKAKASKKADEDEDDDDDDD